MNSDLAKLQTLYDPALDEKYHISLKNFDEHKSGPPYLTSPRSIEACLRQGVKPKDLIVRYVSRIRYQPCGRPATQPHPGVEARGVKCQA